MKCKNCGLVNPEGATHCARCHTMIRTREQNAPTGGSRALIQIALLIGGMVAVVVILWILLHDIFHAV
jgi:hypothetical protein